MKPHIFALCNYFDNELPNLKDNYKWKISNINGFDKNGEESYLANVELKQYFNRKWSIANKEERIRLSESIVKDWGQVKSNSFSTLKSYVDEIEKKNPSTPIKGVASYSKIFSVTDLRKYAIYDARVATCLNAIQWNAGIKGVAFNYIPGRNNVTGNVIKKSGFAYQEEFKVETLIINGWQRLKKVETYCFYIDTLAECLKAFPDNEMYDLEMILFANAEKECLKAMNKVDGLNV